MSAATSTARVALVTGALTGIGRATALELAAGGARVVAAGRNAEAGRRLAAQLISLGTQAAFVHVDVRKEADVEALVAATLECFGRLDAAVNCAGIEGATGPLTERTVTEFTDAFESNVLGTFLCMKHELAAMQPRRGGSIINLSSTMGSRGAGGASLYVASKHAVEGLTKSAAIEAAAYNVRVNAIAPGPVDTALLTRFAGGDERKAAVVAAVPLKRAGLPEEIARVIAFISSEQAAFVTGEIIHVNGGRTAS